LYIKEVDFIPLAVMVPKPIVGNFFGYSLAERLVPLQEYKTAINRAEIAFAMQASTPRIGVNPEFVDAEEIQRGVSALFILDRKFDPSKHVYEFEPMQGNLGYVQDSMERFDGDVSRMLGMTNPGDTLNPEVMKDGNSGYKLQLAMGPNQLIQDEMVKNCAAGLRDLIYIVWKTMIQYSDDYNIKQLADAMLPGSPFLDAQSMENFQFIDRNMINIDLALGFLSDENRLTRQQLIAQAQQQFAGIMMQLDPSVPEMFAKARRPFEDTLYALGVKHCDSYLPTFEEAVKMAQSKAQQPPSPEQQEMKSKTDLNNAKVQESQTVAALNIKKAEDIDVDNMFEAMAAKRGKLSAVEID
jgi:thiol-disulfide isomerase/thioredoxin